MTLASPFRAVSRVFLAVVSLTVLGLASARANQTGDKENTLLTGPYAGQGARQDDGLEKFHSDLLGPDAVAFFFPPITVPPRPVPEPVIPVTPHLPPPPVQPSPPPVDTVPEPATLISSALGAGLLGLYSLRRRWGKRQDRPSE
jgi:hypothetical protein